MKRSTLGMTLLSLLLFACVGLTACGTNSAGNAQQNTPVPNDMQRKAMDFNELIAQLKAAGAKVVTGTGINQPFMTVEGRTLTVNGEQIQVDWVKPPHLYKAGRIIVFYIGANDAVMHLLIGVLGKQFAGK